MRKIATLLLMAAVILGMLSACDWIRSLNGHEPENIRETQEEEVDTEPMDPLILVNAEHLYQGKRPRDLVRISQISNGITLSKGDLMGVREAVVALAEMNDAMIQEGLGPLLVTSAYRSVSYQESLFKNKVERVMAGGIDDQMEARRLAAREVAKPGTSEHHTGLAFDLAGPDGTLESFEETSVCQWLGEHAHEYGFIKRYPGEKSEITGIIDEPWHYRYVGAEAAGSMAQAHLCLEEYVQSQEKTD